MYSGRESKVVFGKKEGRIEGRGSEAAVCQRPIESSPARLC